MDEIMLKEMGARALNAKYALQKLTATEKNKALLHAFIYGEDAAQGD